MNLEIFTEIKLNDYICYIIIIGLLWYIYLDSPIPNSFNLNDKYKYNYFVFTFIFIFSCSLVFTNYIVCGILIIILYEITNKIDIEERRKNKKTNNKNNSNTNNSNTNMRSMVSCESNIQNVKWEQTLEENLVDNTKLLSTKNILHLSLIHISEPTRPY